MSMASTSKKEEEEKEAENSQNNKDFFNVTANTRGAPGMRRGTLMASARMQDQ